MIPIMDFESLFPGSIVIDAVPDSPPSAAEFRSKSAKDNLKFRTALAVVNFLGAIMPTRLTVHGFAAQNATGDIYLTSPVARELFGDVEPVAYVAIVEVDAGGFRNRQAVNLGQMLSQVTNQANGPIPAVVGAIEGVTGFILEGDDAGQPRMSEEQIWREINGVQNAVQSICAAAVEKLRAAR